MYVVTLSNNSRGSYNNGNSPNKPQAVVSHTRSRMATFFPVTERSLEENNGRHSSRGNSVVNMAFSWTWYAVWKDTSEVKINDSKRRWGERSVAAFQAWYAPSNNTANSNSATCRGDTCSAALRFHTTPFWARVIVTAVSTLVVAMYRAHTLAAQYSCTNPRPKGKRRCKI